MTEVKTIRLSNLAREFNVGIQTIVDFLHKKGYVYDPNPNTKVSMDALALLEKEYKVDLHLKKESEKIILKSQRPKQEIISIDDKLSQDFDDDDDDDYEEAEEQSKLITKKKPEEKPKKKVTEEVPVEKLVELDGIKIVGKVDLESLKKPVKKTTKAKKETKVEKPKSDKKTKEKTEIPAEPVEESAKPTDISEVKPEPEKVQKTEAEAKTKTEPEPQVTPIEKTVKEDIIETEIPKVEELKVIGPDLQKRHEKSGRSSEKSEGAKKKLKQKLLKLR